MTGFNLLPKKKISNLSTTASKEIKKFKIKKIDIFKYDIPLHEPYQDALTLTTKAKNVLIRIHTDAGIIGIGEATPYRPVTGETQDTVIEAAKEISRCLIGKDPFSLEKIISDIEDFIPHNTSTKAAFDMALFDIVGKTLEQPLYRLLGGDNHPFETDHTVSLASPAIMAEKASKIIEKGFKTIKVKAGRTLSQDLETIKSIREAVGYDIQLRIDANQSWNPAQGIRNLNQLREYKIQLVEQPVPYWDIDGMKFIRERSEIPVLADESVHSPYDAFKVVKSDATDYINIKLTKSGGIKNAIKINNIAESAGVKCMVGCMLESRISLSAVAHLVLSSNNIIFADLDSSFFLKEDPVIDGLKIEKGLVTLPEKFGIGADIDPIFLKKMQAISI